MPQIYSKSWIVQKYGGTSIGKLLPTITSNIIPSYLASHNVAIVCSARSGTTKTAGTTSLLLDAIRLVTSGETATSSLDEVIDQIKTEHLRASRMEISANNDNGNEDALWEVEMAIKKDCEGLRSMLKATWILGEVSEKTRDRVLSVGEVLACRIVAGSLSAKGISAEVVILDDVVQSTYGAGTIDLSRSYKANPAAFLRGLVDAILKKVNSCTGKVPVITGFFGAMPNSLVETVGRGYSDLCAALCAVALNATELQIWKEVDGFFTADPRKVKAARLLATVTHEEAAELTYYGCEVIHPLTIEQIGSACIPLRLKNVMNVDGPGTIIDFSTQVPTPSDPDAIAKTAFMTTHGYYGPTSYRRRPTAVTEKEGIAVLNIQSNGSTPPATFFSRISVVLENCGVTIDLISSSRQMLSLAVCCSESKGLQDAVSEIKGLGSVSLMQNLSIISVVGHKMRNMVGSAAEVFSALASAKVNIYLISQGASEVNISFVVNARDAIQAMEVVHLQVMGIPVHKEMENAFAKGPWLY